jgi:hypothetical protein
MVYKSTITDTVMQNLRLCMKFSHLIHSFKKGAAISSGGGGGGGRGEGGGGGLIDH